MDREIVSEELTSRATVTLFMFGSIILMMIRDVTDYLTLNGPERAALATEFALAIVIINLTGSRSLLGQGRLANFLVFIIFFVIIVTSYVSVLS
jgi:hypothetical protein